MAKRHLTGAQKWEGYQILCRPPEIFGIDRRFIALLTINFVVWWQGFQLTLLGLIFTYMLYYLFRSLTKMDPQFFTILQGAARHPAAWYDPGAAPVKFGAYVAGDVAELVRLDARMRLERRDRRRSGGRFARLYELVDMLVGSSKGER